MKHRLKIQPCYFNPVIDGDKRFEIRYNEDRCFQRGDEIELREYFADGYTGRSVVGHITYVTNFKQHPGYVVFGFALISDKGMMEGQV